MKPIQYFLVYFSLLLAPLTGFAQFDIPNIPEHQTSLYDYAEMLDSIERYSLETKLLNYADTTSTQIVIATVKNLKGDSAEHVAPLWAQKWGIGQADKDNGVFILVSKEDREMYIATGYGVQGRLTAGITGQIIRDYMLPDFKTERYYFGLDNGTDAIFKALNGKFKAGIEDVQWWKNNKNPWVVLMWIVLLISGLFFGLLLFAWLTRFLPDTKYVSIGKGGKHKSWKFPSIKTGGKRGFKGGFGGGGFSGGGAGGSW
ncbi:TPM domain-containing protein [Flavobacterium sp. RHBU_3]|uniref:TPM domain-containing protein n=1 Tax=Flavobacterium sp. RHBU_3 TaxID=3391184 RepID=UPI0039853ABB